MERIDRPISTPQDRVICDALMSRAGQVGAAELAALPWWRFGSRDRLRHPVKATAAAAARAAGDLKPMDVEIVANGLLETEWYTHVSRHAPKTNPWHPKLAAERHGLSEQLTTAAIGQNIYRYPTWGGEPWPVAELRRVLPLLTPQRCRDYLDGLAAEVAAAVASEDFMTAEAQQQDTKRDLSIIVEHPATGIRAVFHLPNTDGTCGYVLSKPYRITPLHPTLNNDWERHAGLGVGTRLYLKAAEQHPTVRWGHGLLSEYSESLRRKLHQLDPYRWYYNSCRWCSDRGTDSQERWMAADHHTFTDHTGQVVARWK